MCGPQHIVVAGFDEEIRAVVVVCLEKEGFRLLLHFAQPVGFVPGGLLCKQITEAGGRLATGGGL
jgi:hypothetical protein